MGRPRSIAIMAAILALLAAAFFVLSRSAPPVEPKALPFVWQFPPDLLTTVSVALPREGKEENWIRRAVREWVFQESGDEVDEERWGLGIPLLLSGPRAARLINAGAASGALDAYGLALPRVTLRLGLADGRTIVAHVGDETPDGGEDYIAVEGSPAVYAVHRDWAAVIERLVREPPVARAP